MALEIAKTSGRHMLMYVIIINVTIGTAGIVF